MAEPASPKERAALFERPNPGFVLTKDDWSAWLKREARENWRGPGMLVGFSLFAGAIVLFGIPEDDWTLRFGLAAFTTVTVYLAGRFHSFVWHRRMVGRWKAPGPMTVDINPYRDELVETAGGTVRAYPWIGVIEALRDPAHVFITLRAAPVIIIPKSAFADEAAAESFARFVDQRAISAEDDARHAANSHTPD